MSAADDEAAKLFAAVPFDEPDDTFTLGDFTQTVLDLAPEFQSHVLAAAVRKDPTIAAGIWFPDEPDAARRVSHSVELRRLIDRDRAREAYDLLRASEAKPLYPTALEHVVERLSDGLLQRPAPSVGGLLYPSRVNAVYGTHTAGKTWLGLHLARLNAESGGHTLVIDYEDSDVGIAERCLALDPSLAEHVSYVAPEGPINGSHLEQIIRQRRVTLVLLDSVGESMSVAGLDSNLEPDVTRWFREVPDTIAALGPAVLIIDHIAKKQDGTPSPVGSFRKSAAITGAQFALENRVGFSRSQAGWSRLTCTKDRNGYFATGQVVGRVDFSPGEGSMSVTFRAGEDEAARLHDSMEQAILDYVRERMAEVHGRVDDDGEEMDGRPNITQIRAAVRGDNGKIKDAVDRLVLNGWLELEYRKSGKTTRDVYVPSTGGLTAISENEGVS